MTANLQYAASRSTRQRPRSRGRGLVRKEPFSHPAGRPPPKRPSRCAAVSASIFRTRCSGRTNGTPVPDSRSCATSLRQGGSAPSSPKASSTRPASCGTKLQARTAPRRTSPSANRVEQAAAARSVRNSDQSVWMSPARPRQRARRRMLWWPTQSASTSTWDPSASPGRATSSVAGARPPEGRSGAAPELEDVAGCRRMPRHRIRLHVHKHESGPVDEFDAPPPAAGLDLANPLRPSAGRGVGRALNGEWHRTGRRTSAPSAVDRAARGRGREGGE